MPVLHKKWLIQPVSVLQLRINHRVKMAPHHRTDWIAGGKISHYEGNERDTDDNEDEADKPFDQELNHRLPLTPSRELKICTRKPTFLSRCSFIEMVSSIAR